MDFLRLAGKASIDLHSNLLSDMRVVNSSMDSCLNSIDCFGRALAIDNAYRHLSSAEQYLMDAQKMQESAPHTDVSDSALKAIEHAKHWIRPYAVSPDNASCRDPPVCVVDPAGQKLSSMQGLEALVGLSFGLSKNRESAIQFLFI